MKRGDEREIRRTMELVARLPDVMPNEASERVTKIYEELQETLRVPIVNLIFRTLANYPDYLERTWAQLRPVVRTRAFERAADALRAEALLDPVPDASGVRWEETGDLERIRAFNDTIHYVLPKLLLIVTLLDQMSLAPAREAAASAVRDADLSGIPGGAAEGTTKVEMVDPDTDDLRVRRLFDSVKERHGHPLVSSYYRGLGNWPDFLEAVWTRIEPIVGSEPFDNHAHTLIASAQEWARNLPPGEGAIQGPDEGQRMEIRDILAAFRLQFIPDMLLNASLIKALVDGAAAARTSRFSAVRGETGE